MTTEPKETVAEYVARLKALVQAQAEGSSTLWAIPIDKLLAMIADWEAQAKRIRALEDALEDTVSCLEDHASGYLDTEGNVVEKRGSMGRRLADALPQARALLAQGKEAGK